MKAKEMKLSKKGNDDEPGTKPSVSIQSLISPVWILHDHNDHARVICFFIWVH